MFHSKAWLGAAAAAVVGLAAGVFRAGERSPAAADVSAAVRSVGDAVARDDLESVWNGLDPATRERIGRSHAGLVDATRAVLDVETPDEGTAGQAAAIVKEYGMPLPALVATDAESLWIRRTRAALGDPAAARPAFAGLAVEAVESDGTRAWARCRLGDGRVQGLHLVRRAEAWRLVDFRPYGNGDAPSKGRGRRVGETSGGVDAPVSR